MKYLHPEILLNEANQEMCQIPLGEFFNDPKYHLTMEKWSAAKFGMGFARLVAPCLISVNPDQQDSADFFLKRENKAYRFQNVEVIVKGRKRGEEYRKGVPVWNPATTQARTKQSLGWVFDAIYKKV